MYVGLIGFVARLGLVAPDLPAGAPLSALGATRGWILLLILAVWAYDTGAFFVGRRWGRARFLVHISPSKTYAGLVGGIAASTAVVAAMLWALGAAPLGAVILGPVAKSAEPFEIGLVRDDAALQFGTRFGVAAIDACHIELRE